MISLVTLQRAKLHLNVVDNEHDADIVYKAQQASGILLDYIKVPIPEELESLPWAPVPEKLQAYTLLILGELYYNRESSVVDILTKLKDILYMDRYPSMA